MKKGIILILSVFFIGMFSVNAASSCSYKELAELNNIAAQVKTNYEIKVGTLNSDSYGIPDVLIGTPEAESYVAEYKYFMINVLYITEQTYVIISHEDESMKLRANFEDTTNGIYKMEWKNLSSINKLTFEIYSSDKTGCPDEKLYTTYLSLPRANEYSALEACKNNNDFYLCQEFVTFEKIDYETFEKKLNDFKAGKINEEGQSVNKNDNKLFKFVRNHKTAVVATSCVLIVGVVTVITLKKKRRKTDEKLK